MSSDNLPASALDQNKALVHRLIDAVWNQGDFTALDTLFEPESRYVDPNHHRQSAAQMRQAAQLYRSLAPNLHVTIDQSLAEG